MRNWDDLRIFLAVARQESVSSAGRILRLDPATVSRRMRRLEEAVRHPLFAKSPQGYVLTQQGQELLPHAEEMETALAGAQDALGGSSDQLSGQIRIGAPDGCANYLLPHAVAEISRENTNLDIQIIALPRVFNLSKREADMAIAVSRPQTGRLSVQKISDYKLHLAAHREYLHQAPVLNCLSDLKMHRVVGYVPDMIFDKELDYMSGAGVDRIFAASNSVSVQFNMLRQAVGVGIVHDFALPADREIVRVLPDEFSLTRAFHLIRHADDRRVARLNTFAEILVESLRRNISRLESLT